MKTLPGIGLCLSLSVLTFGWIPTAMGEATAPQVPAAQTRPQAPPKTSDLAEYVYLHVTRNQSVPMQSATRTSTCRATNRGLQT